MKWLILLLPFAFALVLLANDRADDASAMRPCEGPFIFGDLNDNDQIDVSDAQLEKDYVLGRDPHFPCGPYDVDCDGSITVADASKIKQAALGHPYHQNEPCQAIGTLYGCIDFNPGNTCEPVSGPTPGPGPTPEPCDLSSCPF